MLAFPQNRVFLGLVVCFRLKNYWFIAQPELLAVVIEKLEAGSGKNNVSNTRYCSSQEFESYNLSKVLNQRRLAQQGNHLVMHILAMHWVCACCHNETVVRQSQLQKTCAINGMHRVPQMFEPRKDWFHLGDSRSDAAKQVWATKLAWTVK
jgi:hypothetical protein